MGCLFVISGPSGSGKTTLTEEILKQKELKNRLKRSISFTTRPRRPGEEDKKDYFFISGEEFKRKLKAKKILEWTRYLGYYYGTHKELVDSALAQEKHILLCVDLKGAASLKQLYPGNAVTIFVMPPSIQELKSRIEKRCSRTTDKEISGRISMAKKEMLLKDRFDYCLVNEDLAAAVAQLKEFILDKITEGAL